MELFWLGQQSCHDISVVGGKAANLSHLFSQNKVPPGFCLSAPFQEVEQLIQSVDEPDRSRTNSTMLQSIIKPAYDELSKLVGVEAVDVAVRSSSTEEDSKDASFAGQHETYLNVVGMELIVEAVTRCFASFTSPQAIEYRKRKGLPIEESRLSVLVQQQVRSDVSAIIFSVNPSSNDIGEVVINASWGQGESIVSGIVTPDTYIVRKTDKTILSRQIAEKLRMTVLVPGGIKQVDVPRVLQNEPCIKDEQVKEMAQLALALEKTQGWPVDIECTYQAKELFLLQCRPITSLAPKEQNQI